MDSKLLMPVNAATGAPLAGVVPSVVAYDRAGNARPAPAVQELATGGYQVTPSNTARELGVVALVDFGPTAQPRMYALAFYKKDRTNQFWAVVVQKPDGSAWDGAAPVTSAYTWADGTDRLAYAPARVAVPLGSKHLFCWTPTQEDIEKDASIVVDAPAGAALRFWYDDAEEATFVSPPDPNAGTTPQDIITAAIAVVENLPLSRDPAQRFIQNKTGQPFTITALARKEGFEVFGRESTFTNAFGRETMYEGQFRMTVRVGTPPFAIEKQREQWLHKDVLRIAHALERQEWAPAGTQAVFFESATTEKGDANWWITEVVFRCVYLGDIL